MLFTKYVPRCYELSLKSELTSELASPICPLHCLLEPVGAQLCLKTQSLVDKLHWKCSHCNADGTVGEHGLALDAHMLSKCSRHLHTRHDTPVATKLDFINLVLEHCPSTSRKDVLRTIHSLFENKLLMNEFNDLKFDTVTRWFERKKLDQIFQAERAGRNIRCSGGGRHSTLDPAGGTVGTKVLMQKFEAQRRPLDSEGHPSATGETSTTFIKEEAMKIASQAAAKVQALNHGSGNAGNTLIWKVERCLVIGQSRRRQSS